MGGLSAKLEADFSDFDRAVITSMKKLEDFERSANRTGASLQRMTTAAPTGLSSMAKGLDQVDKSLGQAGVHIGGTIGAIKELNQAAQGGAASLGALGTAGLVAAAGLTGWNIGRSIADFLGLDKAIGDATASLLGWGTAADQVAGAQADELAKASQRAGRAITDLAEARRINTEGAKKDQEQAKKNAEAYEDYKNAVAHTNDVYLNYQQTLDGINGATVEAIKYLLDQGESQKNLAAEYELTANQIEAINRAREKENALLETQKKIQQDLAAVEQVRIGLAFQQIEQIGKKSTEIEDLKKLTEGYDALKKKLKDLGDAANAAAGAINLERNLGPGQRNIATEAADIRDKELDAAESMRRAGADVSQVMQKIWQDFDARLGQLGPERAGGILPLATQPAPTQNFTISGVFDPRTIQELAAALSNYWIGQAGRQFENR